MRWVPLIAALRNPGLRERHWAQLSAAVGKPILTADGSFSLSVALQINLHAHMKLVEEVSEFASKQYSLERTLDKIQVRSHKNRTLFGVKRPELTYHFSMTIIVNDMASPAVPAAALGYPWNRVMRQGTA